MNINTVDLRTDKVIIAVAKRASGRTLDLTDAITFLQVAFAEQKIACIIAFRHTVPGLGLKDAKRIVEDNLNLSARRNSTLVEEALEFRSEVVVPRKSNTFFA